MIPKILVDDGGVLAWEDFAVVADLANIQVVPQDGVERAPGNEVATTLFSSVANTDLANNAVLIKSPF